MVGIAIANTLAFTGEALLLLYLLRRKVPGLLRVSGTLVRVGLAALAGGAVVFILLQLPLPELPLTLAALTMGGLMVVPFIWPEVKLLIKL